jgi:hypothetical protein
MQMNLAEVHYKDAEWIYVAQDRFHSWVHLNTVMNLWVQRKLEISGLRECRLPRRAARSFSGPPFATTVIIARLKL